MGVTAAGGVLGRGVVGSVGAAVRAGVRCRAAQFLRADGSLRGVHGRAVDGRVGCCADRCAHLEHAGVRTGRVPATGAAGGGGRVVPRGHGGRAWISRPACADRGAVRRLSVRRAGRADVPHR